MSWNHKCCPYHNQATCDFYRKKNYGDEMPITFECLLCGIEKCLTYRGLSTLPRICWHCILNTKLSMKSLIDLSKNVEQVNDPESHIDDEDLT